MRQSLLRALKRANMSVVIEFRVQGTRPPRQEAATGNAQVIIFPGVHVEHREFSLADRMALPRLKPLFAGHAEADEG